MLLNVNLTDTFYSRKVDIATKVDIENQLVAGLQSQSREAQEQFYKHFFPIMFPTALRYGASQEDANEIINTAFLKVIRTIDKYKTQNFGGWVRTIVKRTAIDYGRKFNYDKVSTVEILEIDERTYNSALADLNVEDILKLFSKLPNATRVVFNLFIFEELTHDEIAKKLSISKGTSKWHVSNARKLLMDLIKSL